MNDIDSLFNLIRANPDKFYQGQNCSEEKIDAAEEKLNVIFPKSYRLFLSAMSLGSFGGIEIYGITQSNPDSPLPPNLVGVNISGRNKYNYSEELIVISNNGDGYIYYLASVENRDDESPVYIATMANLNNREIEAPKFEDFLRQRVAIGLEDDEDDF